MLIGCASTCTLYPQVRLSSARMVRHQVFAEAKGQDAVLVFDEAEGLFAQRTNEGGSTSRHDSMNVGILLHHVRASYRRERVQCLWVWCLWCGVRCLFWCSMMPSGAAALTGANAICAQMEEFSGIVVAITNRYTQVDTACTRDAAAKPHAQSLCMRLGCQRAHICAALTRRSPPPFQVHHGVPGA